MRSYLITVALAVFAALSFGLAFASDEANQFDVNAIPHGTATGAEVKAELARAVRLGANYESVGWTLGSRLLARLGWRDRRGHLTTVSATGPAT